VTTKRTGTAAKALANGQIVKPTVGIRTITPTQAAQMLDEQNVRNRSLRESRVTHLAGILKRGEWMLTGDAIVFDLDNVLLNGQHRLAACAVSELPIEVVVLRNLPRKSQDVMDDTLSRKLGDALKLRGETDVHKLAAGIGWYARIVYAEMTNQAHYANDAVRPSIPQLLQVYAENPGLRDAARKSQKVQKQLKLRPGPLTALWYRFSLVDEAHTEVFFDKLRSGADLSEGSPILALRRYSENERDRSRRRGPDFKWVAVTIKAWNAWREGRTYKEQYSLSFNYSPLVKENWPEPE
jgi:hypothetical protein